jgi:glycosyltransferase involved in cell wall biosynthesis
MIEAMACGTPVLAFRCGSVPEIIDPGVTGLVVDTMDEAVQMLPDVIALDRHAVRRRFDERFSATRMAKDYAQLYRSLLKKSSLPESALAARDARSGRAADGYPRLQPELEKEMN